VSVRYRYLKWDGTQDEFRLETEELFKELSNFLMEGWTPDEAIDWILKQGVSGKGFRVMGIEDLRSEIARYRDEQLRRWDFGSPLAELREQLERIVELEKEHIESALADEDPEEYERRKGTLENLPRRLSSAVSALSDYDFMDEEAARRFDELRGLLEGIKRLEKFLNRYGDRNTGKEPLTLEQALDILDEFERLERLEHNLRTGQLSEITSEELGELLGEAAYESFLLLRDFRSRLESAGYITSRGQHTELTPKGIRKIGEMALRDVFSSLDRHKFGTHETPHRGEGSIKAHSTKQYEFGDPFNVNVVSTLKKSLARGTKEGRIELAPEDFEVYESEFNTVATTALLLDLSWSMSFQGRFPAAKRVALAMEHLISTRHPRDNFYIIGFSTRARLLTPQQLSLTSWDSNDPFTNIQEAIHLATKLIAPHRTPNKQIILITDGQPTAYYVDGYLQVELPMFFGGLSPRATFETLKEIKRCTAKGITINTFMLDDSPTLRRFVDEMTRINKGRAFFTTPSQLGKYLLVDYFTRRKKVV